MGEKSSNLIVVFIDDYLPDNLFIQVGYFQTGNGTILPFGQVWNVTALPYAPISSSSGPSTTVSQPSYNTYTAEAIAPNSDIWGFYFNGIEFGTYNFGSSLASISTQSHVLLEQQTTAATPFRFNTINIQSAQYVNSGGWHYIASAVSYSASPWNVQGQIQNPTLYAGDQFSISATQALPPGTQIWNSVG